MSSAPTPLEDLAFDAAYPAPIRRVSRRFWTPVAVARRAAELFRKAGARRTLDVGAGAGKFVLAAAASVPEIEFVGIEQRADLVEVARRVQFELGVRNAQFRRADFTRVSWASFDSFYFFNPLAENLFATGDRIDDRVELTDERFVREVLWVERALREAPLGSLVVTYHGSSTRMPACYDLCLSERAGSDWLRLWVKRRETDDGSFFLEVDDTIVWHPAGGAVA
jgi:SAM-dependent methyltransferase